MIIAANVLHATADLRETLGHVRQLLSSEGLLVLLECTRPLRFADVIVGLTEGWWKFADTELRPAHALLSAAKWERLLTAADGFTEVAVSPNSDEESVLSKQSVILARGPKINNGTWLVFDDSNGTGKSLQTALTSSGRSCILVAGGYAYTKHDDEHFEINPHCPEHFRQLLQQVLARESALEGVVYLWPLKACSDAAERWEILKGRIEEGCGGILHLTKALVSGGAPPAKNLWIVTRGAYAVNPDVGVAALAQSPASAVGSTISLEYPEIRCVRLDLAAADSANETELLLREVMAGADDSLVAFRGERRFTAKLVEGEIGPRHSPAHPEIGGPYQLGISSPGILENLSLSPQNRRAPGTGEVEIEVHATGLGFRDVLMALGKYPEPPSVFGYECVGTIVGAGAEVPPSRIGQRVIAVGPGSFASFLTISLDRTAPVPESLEDGEAATIPSAFLTAHYALNHLARMTARDKVLIHAAAGGVGLAAVQLAQKAGAEIFATAGTPEKRTYLKSLGVHHVFDSRSVQFSNEILKITGGRGVDIVLNSLTGEFIPKSLAMTAANGRFVEIGKNGIWDAQEVARFNSSLSYFPVDLSLTFDKYPGLLRSLLDELMSDFANGSLKPLPHKIFPVEKLVSAFRFMAQARHIGKVVVSQRNVRDPLLKPGATYLITGGLSGLGLLVAQWMAERGATHLVLLGRSEPSAEAAAIIRGIEKKGIHVVVSRGDVSNRDHLEQLFSTFGRSMPDLRGIVHSAGTLDDGVLAQQSWERFEKVMAPKVDGSWYLHTLSENQALDFFVLFSSAVSMLGSSGQANHVAACSFQDALARYRCDRGLPALSINWGPWGEVGAATRSMVSDRLSMKGFHLIEPQQGLHIMEQLLLADRVQFGVMSVDWRQYVDSLPHTNHSKLFSKLLEGSPTTSIEPRSKTSKEPALLEQLRQASARNRRSLLEKHVREQAIKVLGLKPSFKLDLDQGLANLGMDSLMTIELKNRLQSSVGKTLPSTIVFDHPTVAALAEYLEVRVLALAEDGERLSEQASSDKETEAADALTRLSDDEAEAILMKELSDSQAVN